MTAPITTPPTIISRVVRNARLAKIHAAIGPTTTHGTHALAAAGRPTLTSTAGRSEVAAPTSIRTGSSAVARHTTNTPFNVMYAEMPMKTRTISDLRLPPPIRIKVLLPQPEASAIPNPNRKPPTSIDSHATRGPV